MRQRSSNGFFHSVQGLASSPIYADGLVILAIDQTQDAFAAAFEAATGKQRWKAPLSGRWRRQAVLTNQQGKTAVVKAGPQWEIVAVRDAEEQTYAAPAAAAGGIFIPTRQPVYCFGQTDTLG